MAPGSSAHGGEEGTSILLFIAIILILALFAVHISDKSGLPSLLLFLLLGILCSSFGVDFEDYSAAEGFATVALILIMFYGGFGTNWKMGQPVVREAAVLSSLGVVLTAALTGLFAYAALGFPLLESMLLGSIIGSTDYTSVANILASKNLNLKYHTASLLELESGSNDPAAYTMTFVFLALIAGTDFSLPLMVLREFGLGTGLGFLIAWAVFHLLRRVNLQKDSLAIVFIFAMALFTYSFTDFLGGNGYLAVYLSGIYLGNKSFISKRDILYFFDGLTELMSIGLFFLLGLLATPAKVLENLPLALVIMVFVTLLARPVTVVTLMLPFHLKARQLAIVSWAGLRGAAAIAFAIMAINSGLSFSIDIYHLVFGVCLLSSLLQGSLMAFFAQKSDMIDPENTVLRTFNYYVMKSRLTFLKFIIDRGSRLAGRPLMEIPFKGSFIVAKIVRSGKVIVPRGDVVLQEGDAMIIIGEEYFDPHGQDLLEFSITEDHDWADQKIVDLQLPPHQIVLTICRDEKFLVAKGDTIIRPGDRVILFQEDMPMSEDEKIR